VNDVERYGIDCHLDPPVFPRQILELRSRRLSQAGIAISSDEVG